MIKLSNNKKGFTLIELLAVIVILAILVMLAIPMVTRYLTQARKGTYVDNAREAINAVRTDMVTRGFSTTGNTEGDRAWHAATDSTKAYITYNKTQINKLLEKQLINSPFGAQFKDDSYVKVTLDGETYTYEICLYDEGGNGIGNLTAENALDDGKVTIGGVTACSPANS